MSKLGELGEMSFGNIKLGELGKMSFRMSKLGKLGERALDSQSRVS